MNSDTVDYDDSCLIVRYLASMRPFAQSFDIYLTQVRFSGSYLKPPYFLNVSQQILNILACFVNRGQHVLVFFFCVFWNISLSFSDPASPWGKCHCCQDKSHEMSVWGGGCGPEHTCKSTCGSKNVFKNKMDIYIYTMLHPFERFVSLPNLHSRLPGSRSMLYFDEICCLCAWALFFCPAVWYAAWRTRPSDGQLHQCERGSCGTAGQVCTEQTSAHWAVLRHARREDPGELILHSSTFRQMLQFVWFMMFLSRQRYLFVLSNRCCQESIARWFSINCHCYNSEVSDSLESKWKAKRS